MLRRKQEKENVSKLRMYSKTGIVIHPTIISKDSVKIIFVIENLQEAQNGLWSAFHASITLEHQLYTLLIFLNVT